MVQAPRVYKRATQHPAIEQAGMSLIIHSHNTHTYVYTNHVHGVVYNKKKWAI